MKALLTGLWLTLALLSLPVVAEDMKAITEDGRRVILGSDGRWRFDYKASASRLQISDSPYRPAVKAFSVSFDTEKWGLAPANSSEGSNKRAFKHRTLPLYAVVISDEIPVSKEVMRSLIISNAKNGATDVKVLVDETKSSKGKEVGSMRFLANRDGIDFVVASYYYGDGRGNIQVMCWTGQSLFYKYQTDCQSFLDGLSID
ncbi:hypothetical protein [Pseudogulbenkiania subflava]|uniref:Uncharacterized protein n=1 Tax=Pseudogulbenkiania subflava DSM 22618 TaxID=1123014 RepID=A0A1Y6BR24_9NEIS|nr:hypothetical protein [Pseudogulbenkiania subflava]SMF24671.1 hypothetical protein SAMN02745746_02106 [Pseudogulbenkiania subflava DSM 22618]